MFVWPTAYHDGHDHRVYHNHRSRLYDYDGRWHIAAG
jgi:hypothetical protein